MVSNQGWSDDRLQPCQRVLHSIKVADMLAMKIDLLLKKFEDYSQDKDQIQTLQALETRMMCEIYGNVGHSGDNCPETQMGFVHKEVSGGINHAHIIKEVMAIQIFSILTNLP